MKRAIVVLAVCAAGACGKRVDGVEAYKAMEKELVAKHRPALTARLEKLRAIQAASKQHPALAALQPPAAPIDAKPAFLGFGEADVLDRPFDPSEPLVGCTTFFSNDTFAKLNGAVGFWPSKDVQPGPDKRAEVEKAMTDLETAVYALVCVQTAAEKPSLAAASAFTGGIYKADCRVFEIETAKYLGGFTADVKMHGASVNLKGAAAADLEKAMEVDVKGELDRELEKFGKAPEVYCRW
jgi:hypothetical protein